MTRRLPPLQTLRAFEAVVRLGSVSRAADELGRTHGAVSKQLRTLHDHAGLALLDKAGTGLKANAEGRRLASAVGEALDLLAERYGEVTRRARQPELHLACSATFAMRWLVPHLSGFALRHPEVGIRLSMTSAKEMRDERDADLVILWDRAAYPAEDQARAIRLADATFGLVAAPGYAIGRDTAGRITADCRIDHALTDRAWSHWARLSGTGFTAPRTLSFPHSHLCIEAALAGMGVAVVEKRLVAQDLREGRLVSVAPFVGFPDGFAAVPHRDRRQTPQTGRFLAWLAEALNDGSPGDPVAAPAAL